MARVRVLVAAAGTVKERERNRVKERKKSELGPRLGRGGAGSIRMESGAEMSILKYVWYSYV
jgi:hypothetical protein